MSIVSKSITKKLIAENIMGKTICRIAQKNSYGILQVIEFGDRVYAWLRKGVDHAEEPIWTPSFIDVGIWEQAVGNFDMCERLDRNVEQYLLPLMDEYLQGISDAELISMTRDFLIEQGVIYSPVSQRAGRTYYFSEKEIYSCDEKEERFPYEGRVKFHLFDVNGETCFNRGVWRKAVSHFEVGMTLKECVSVFLQTELAHPSPQKLSPVDRLVQGIAPPVYERVPGNNNKATFDHIRVIVGVPRYLFNSWEELRNTVNRYQPEIYQRVIEKIENDRRFKKYGVPINFLKLSDVMLLRDFSVEFVLELKPLKTAPSLDKEGLIWRQ